jgi:hypothetical protein
MAIDRLYGQGISAGTPTGPPEYAYTQIFDYAGGSSPIYIGWALSSPKPGRDPVMVAQTSEIPATGPLTSGNYWAIQKLTYNGAGAVTNIQWAYGNTQEVNSWDLRASLTYQ